MMKTIAVAVLTLAAAGLCDAQAFRFVDRIQWRAQTTHIVNQPIADKPAHFIYRLSSQAVLASLPDGSYFGVSGATIRRNSWKYSIVCSVLYELKDGFVPWSTKRWWGGDGFDPGDLAADFAGIAYERGRRKLPPAVRLLIIPLEVWAITALFNKWDGKL